MRIKENTSAKKADEIQYHVLTLHKTGFQRNLTYTVYLTEKRNELLRRRNTILPPYFTDHHLD